MQMIIGAKTEKSLFFSAFFDEKPFPPGKMEEIFCEKIFRKRASAYASELFRSGNSSQATVTFRMLPNRSKRGSAENIYRRLL